MMVEKNRLPPVEEIDQVTSKTCKQLPDVDKKIIEERATEIDVMNKENLAAYKSSPIPKSKASQEKCKCSPCTEDSNCKVCQLNPTKTLSHPGDSRAVLDIP